MKNPLLARLLGEDEVVPVMAGVTRDTYRRRMLRPGEKQPRTDRELPEQTESRDAVKFLVRENRDPQVIPDDATPVDDFETIVGKPMQTPKEVVMEPSYPGGDREKFQTPYAALTAPDVTPQSTEPIDPSNVPGAQTPETFRAGDLSSQPDQRTNSAGDDTAARAMNILLGHSRVKVDGQEQQEFQQAGAFATEESAAAYTSSPLMEGDLRAKAAAMTASGGGMPDPKPQGDGSAVYSAFRRFSS